MQKIRFLLRIARPLLFAFLLEISVTFSFAPVQTTLSTTRSHQADWTESPVLFRLESKSPRQSCPLYHPTSKHHGSRFALSAVPPSIWWILGHNVLGVTPAFVVAPATKQGGWYRKINLPSWNPPDWLFGPVWTFLYSCMGIAVSKIYSTSKISSTTKTLLLLFWLIHFALNLSWAPTFFGLQQFKPALIISTLMVITLLTTIPLFYTVNPMSGLLLLPYLCWITFATVLNYDICKRNPTKDGYNDAMFQAQLQKLQENAAKYANSSG